MCAGVPIDPDDPVRDKKNVDDLQKEGRLLSALKHPHVLLFLGCHFSWPNFYVSAQHRTAWADCCRDL